MCSQRLSTVSGVFEAETLAVETGVTAGEVALQLAEALGHPFRATERKSKSEHAVTRYRMAVVKRNEMTLELK